MAYRVENRRRPKCTRIWRRLYPKLFVLSVFMLAGCEKSPQVPEKIDLEAAAVRWNSPEKTWDEADLIRLERGKNLYKSNCAACHQATGKGESMIGAPALKGNSVVAGSIEVVTGIVRDGRNGMPSFRKSLSDTDLAAVIIYVRNSWGNNIHNR